MLIYRVRWLLGLLILIVAVIFEIHGSSIGMWNYYLQAGTNKQGLLIGQDRPIRSDEWAVFTPMTLSQYHNQFRVTSDILRATDTDVYMVYGQPVRDWTAIFRPFQLGYLFLSPAKGLSFYWVGKLMALLLVSFEFGMLITKRNKALSLAYSFMVSYAPVVQWWFSVNAFPDMLVYGQSIILCISHYLTSDKYWKRFLYSIGLFLFCGAYLLVLYPAWQIPFFYVYGAVGGCLIVSNWKKTFFQWHRDIPILGFAVILLIVSMYYIISRSWSAITTVMNSVYPGYRMETGGNGLAALFQYIGNPFFPFKEQNVPANVCEMAVFYDMFPLGIVLSFFVLYRRGWKDTLINVLIIVCLFLGFYVVMGFPAFLSDVTLLSQSQASRCLVALSYVNLLLVFCSLARMQEEGFKVPRLMGVMIACIVAIIMTYYSSRFLYSGYYDKKLFWGCTAILAIVFFAALLNGKYFCFIALVLSIIAGGAVNPIRTGIGIVDENVVGRQIEKIAENDDGKWIAVSDQWVMGNFLPIYGAKTINSTNTYMNRELWNILDPDREYEDIYNRYAHITISLTSSKPTTISLISGDLVHVLLNVEDLEKIGVKYIFSNAKLDVFNDDVTYFQKLTNNTNIPYNIFQVKKSGERMVSDTIKMPMLPSAKMSEETVGHWIASNGICIDTANNRGTENKGVFYVEPDDEIITINGWAADFINNAPFEKLYLQIDDEIILCDYGIQRDDVADVFQSKKLLNTGFSVSFLLETESEEKQIAFFGISSDGKYMYEPVMYTVIRKY